MGIMTRILRLWKADIHGVMDQLEDKELLMKQYLREMEIALQKKVGQLHQIAETLRRLENDLTVRRNEIVKQEKDLTLALQKEKDDIAKLLIRKQRIQQKHCEQLQLQYQALQEEQEHLSQRVNEQRLQYQTLKTKAATFCHTEKQTTFNEAETINEGVGKVFTFDEDEIELELLRRKEHLHNVGDSP